MVLTEQDYLTMEPEAYDAILAHHGITPPACINSEPDGTYNIVVDGEIVAEGDVYEWALSQ